MNIKEEIDKLWNQEGLPLEKYYEQVIQILKEGMDKNEEVPKDTLIETLVSANTTLGFGTSFDEAKTLFQAFSLVKNESGTGKIPKIYRFSCLLISVTLTLLSVDEVSTKKELKKILNYINIDASSSRVNVIKSLFNQMSVVLKGLSANYWSLEFLTFMVMLHAYLEEFGTVEEPENNIYNSIVDLHKSWDQNDQDDLKQWRDRWLEGNDYYRLNAMMIFGKPPSFEDKLLEKLNEIYPQ